jgi:hypothetical protein
VVGAPDVARRARTPNDNPVLASHRPAGRPLRTLLEMAGAALAVGGLAPGEIGLVDMRTGRPGRGAVARDRIPRSQASAITVISAGLVPGELHRRPTVRYVCGLGPAPAAGSMHRDDEELI